MSYGIFFGDRAALRGRMLPALKRPSRRLLAVGHTIRRFARAVESLRPRP